MRIELERLSVHRYTIHTATSRVLEPWSPDETPAWRRAAPRPTLDRLGGEAGRSEPATISISSTGAPNCTKLQIVTAKRNFRVKLKVYKLPSPPPSIHGTNREWTDMRAGTHTFTFCAAYPHVRQPHEFGWIVTVRHAESSTEVVVKVGQPFTVIP
jgi:hypothetical protein